MSGYALQCRQQDNANGFFYKKNPTQFDQDQFGKDKALQRGDVYIVEAEEVWTDLVPFPLGILRLYRPYFLMAERDLVLYIWHCA